MMNIYRLIYVFSELLMIMYAYKSIFRICAYIQKYPKQKVLGTIIPYIKTLMNSLGFSVHVIKFVLIYCV